MGLVEVQEVGVLIFVGVDVARDILAVFFVGVVCGGVRCV